MFETILTATRRCIELFVSLFLVGLWSPRKRVRKVERASEREENRYSVDLISRSLFSLSLSLSLTHSPRVRERKRKREGGGDREGGRERDRERESDREGGRERDREREIERENERERERER